MENADFYQKHSIFFFQEHSNITPIPDLMRCDFFDYDEIELRRRELLSTKSPLSPIYHVDSMILPTWCKNIPEVECRAPRDGDQLKNTADYLFLASFLERDKDTNNVLEYIQRGNKDLWFYTLESSDVTSPPGFELQEIISYRQIEKILITRYLDTRRCLAGCNPSFMSFLIGNMVLRPENSKGDELFWKFVGELEHPFTKEGDPLINNLSFKKSSPYLEYHPNTSAVCPFDGRVTPIIGYSISPEKTWSGRCGRAFQLYLCPKCLGSIHYTLWLMN